MSLTSGATRGKGGKHYLQAPTGRYKTSGERFYPAICRSGIWPAG